MGTTLTLDPSSDLSNLSSPEKSDLITCGIIMPIAAIGTDYSEQHWKDVKDIISEAIKLAGFTPRIVSDSEDSTIIHKSIINNIYSDSIVVCDVSGKNPNVMFELGMRLAFDKPVVIVKDDKTGYSFDTSNIQHLAYRKDLRHNTVETFIKELALKITATKEAPFKREYQSFLSHFGKFEIAKIENTSILGADALQKLFEKVDVLQDQVSNLSVNVRSNAYETLFIYEALNTDSESINAFSNEIDLMFGKQILLRTVKTDKGYNILVKVAANTSQSEKGKLNLEIRKRLSAIDDDLPF